MPHSLVVVYLHVSTSTSLPQSRCGDGGGQLAAAIWIRWLTCDNESGKRLSKNQSTIHSVFDCDCNAQKILVWRNFLGACKVLDLGPGNDIYCFRAPELGLPSCGGWFITG